MIQVTAQILQGKPFKLDVIEVRSWPQFSSLFCSNFDKCDRCASTAVDWKSRFGKVMPKYSRGIIRRLGGKAAVGPEYGKRLLTVWAILGLFECTVSGILGSFL